MGWVSLPLWQGKRADNCAQRACPGRTREPGAISTWIWWCLRQAVWRHCLRRRAGTSWCLLWGLQLCLRDPCRFPVLWSAGMQTEWRGWWPTCILPGLRSVKNWRSAARRKAGALCKGMLRLCSWIWGSAWACGCRRWGVRRVMRKTTPGTIKWLFPSIRIPARALDLWRFRWTVCSERCCRQFRRGAWWRQERSKLYERFLQRPCLLREGVLDGSACRFRNQGCRFGCWQSQ